MTAVMIRITDNITTVIPQGKLTPLVIIANADFQYNISRILLHCAKLIYKYFFIIIYIHFEHFVEHFSSR